MIHYHGGPIWPEEAAALIWKSRHAFVSFARPEQTNVAASVCQSFALDNGAFTAWKSGKEYDFDGYVDYVNEWKNHPGFDFCLIPDVIDGDEFENKYRVYQWGFPKFMSVPVWHLHESLGYLDNLVINFPRIAFGSSGEFATVGTKEWRARMAQAMKVACDKNGRPKTKFHGLRMLNPKVFQDFPFSSADSTNIAINCRDSSRWKGSYKPPNNKSRGILLADRIESFNSADSFLNNLNKE